MLVSHALARTLACALAAATTAAAQAFKVGGPGRFPCSTRDAAGAVTMDTSMCTRAAMTAAQVCPPGAGEVGVVDGGFKTNGGIVAQLVCSLN